MIPMLHWQAGPLRPRDAEPRAPQSARRRPGGARPRAAGRRRHPALAAARRRCRRSPASSSRRYYQTSARAGGDYYDFFPLDDGGWGLFIADVSGHGTPAAVLMAITHAIAHAQPGTHTPPAGAAATISTTASPAPTPAAARSSPPSTPCSIPQTAHADLLPRRPQPAAARRAASSVIPLDRRRRRCRWAILDDAGLRAKRRSPSSRGDLLLLYTDGITEACAAGAPGDDRPRTIRPRPPRRRAARLRRLPHPTCIDRVRGRLRLLPTRPAAG